MRSMRAMTTFSTRSPPARFADDAAPYFGGSFNFKCSKVQMEPNS